MGPGFDEMETDPGHVAYPRTTMDRFFVEILKREKSAGEESPPRYLPTGQEAEVLAMNEWEAGRKLFAMLGLVSLPAPTFALRVRRILPAGANVDR